MEGTQLQGLEQIWIILQFENFESGVIGCGFTLHEPSHLYTSVGESKRAEVRSVFETVATQRASLAIPLR